MQEFPEINFAEYIDTNGKQWELYDKQLRETVAKLNNLFFREYIIDMYVSKICVKTAYNITK